MMMMVVRGMVGDGSIAADATVVPVDDAVGTRVEGVSMEAAAADEAVQSGRVGDGVKAKSLRNRLLFFVNANVDVLLETGKVD